VSESSLIIKILADTSSAEAGISRLSGTLGKALGIGAIGAGAGLVTDAAIEQQSAMARIQAAYNNVDFTPGTAKYAAAKDALLKDSTVLATSFSDLADVYSQGARFVDDFGNKLPTDKVNEYVDTMARLAKVSTDALSATDAGQRVDVFEKLFGQTNFAAVGSAVSAESGIHNQGEGPMLDTAISIAQYGADLGVSQAQAIGIGNYLTDLKMGGQRGGASVGRMFLRMETSADTVLDPDARYADEQKKRTAQERLDDLQTSLKEAELKHSEMYGQNGLKAAYRHNPEAVMAADDQIAKLKRDIADQQLNIDHENDPNRSRPLGKMNVNEMAATAGMDQTAYAELVKSNPMEALLDYTRGLHELPEDQRSAAMAKAGIVGTKDLQTVKGLSDRPDVAADYIARAQAQLDNPTDLPQRSDVILGTTGSKVSDAVNAGQDAAAIIGDPARAALDSGLTKLLDGIQTNGFAPLEADLKNVTDHLDVLDGGLIALAPLMAFFGAATPAVLAKLMGATGGGGGGVPPVVGVAGASGLWGPAALVAATLTGAFFGGKALTDAGVFGADGQRPDPHTAFSDHGGPISLINPDQRLGPDVPPTPSHAFSDHSGPLFQINIDQVHGDAGQAFDSLKTQFIAAWNAAMSGQPVNGQTGGNYTAAPAP